MPRTSAAPIFPDLDERIAAFARCRQALKPVVTQFGAEACQRVIGELVDQKARRAGRPIVFDPTLLTEIWLFVEEGRTRLGLSVNEFCKRSQYTLVDNGKDGDLKVTVLKGATLRRRRQQAVAWLKMLSAPYQILVGVSQKYRADLSGTEEWLRAELAMRLDRSCAEIPQ